MDETVFRAGCAITIHSDILKAGREVAQDRTKLGRGVGGAMWHTKPSIESIRGINRGEGDDIQVDR